VGWEVLRQRVRPSLYSRFDGIGPRAKYLRQFGVNSTHEFLVAHGHGPFIIYPSRVYAHERELRVV
jgi:hypothetical protein